jgi:phosphoglycolate phosphatase
MTPHWLGRPLKAVLWDLDGTLIDTAEDIATALNRAFTDLGLATVPGSAVRTMIGRGAPMLIARALEFQGVQVHDATREALLQRFLVQYEHMQEEGVLTAVAYPGAAYALDILASAGVRLACVTNKQTLLARHSLEHAGLLSKLELVVGGDTCTRRKPAPDPLQHACRTLGVPVEASLMVGDSLNDVLAARAAPMPVICVPYGYNEGNDPRHLDADAHVESLAELPELLGLAGSPDSDGT